MKGFISVMTVLMMFTASAAFAAPKCPVPTPIPPPPHNDQRQKQRQQQKQYQGQGQGQNQQAVGNVAVDTREPFAALPVNPQPFPLLNGRIGEFDNHRIFGMQKCGKDDTIVNVVEVNDGGMFSAIRYKDLNRELLETVRAYRGDNRQLCYWIGYNESSNGGGVGGGATGAMSSGNSFQSVGAAIVPGYNAATFDPKFFIEIDEVVR
jgi:hypothetical protein